MLCFCYIYIQNTLFDVKFLTFSLNAIKRAAISANSEVYFKETVCITTFPLTFPLSFLLSTFLFELL